ncbi:translocation protein SEC72 [Myriangium duriaei CBS 260.36]|uniref:Translocation protein SEC72 n=1 Tax=Myriangium duriaei CBS 260.36 TaxID=1168546 RepID=A0A9P4MM60_9PEZI|nr:translocation protein SEC72 [Myriangium duriaei CBS 260.36]
MESLDTFTQLPLQLDPQTKAISLPHPSTHAVESELSGLNALHRSLIRDLEGPTASFGVPPPPVPVNPKRSAQITKLREAGNASFKKAQLEDAIRLYGLALDMAVQRPVWEASGLVREELSALYGNRAQARMGLRDWPGAAVDAECSVELKKVGNAKGWWRRGSCLREMGRYEEAAEWVREGKEFESAGQDRQGVVELETLERDILEKMEKARTGA